MCAPQARLFVCFVDLHIYVQVPSFFVSLLHLSKGPNEKGGWCVRRLGAEKVDEVGGEGQKEEKGVLEEMWEGVCVEGPRQENR